MNAALALYSAAWTVAKPLLSLNGRLKAGYDQRTLAAGLPAPADVWIQAASGGEAYLAWEMLKRLDTGRPCRVLATTNTDQGYDILGRAAEAVMPNDRGLTVQRAYFPFDDPAIMRRVVEHVRPRVAVLLETEIWPGFLSACRQIGARILLANGRMTTRSMAGYLAAPALFRSLAPDEVLAMSEPDAARFATVFGAPARVVPNIKFDRMGAAKPMPRAKNPAAPFVPERAPFVVFGSIRQQEEPLTLGMLKGLLAARPKTVVGLYPRHMERIDAWAALLAAEGIPFARRSAMDGPAAPGSVILWDAFGELMGGYALAKAAFVGGSLKPLGGQNFLEPLACGTTPVIGPHWKNFTWVGAEIVDSGLVRQAADADQALTELLALVDKTPQRAGVRKRAAAYIQARQGGTGQVCGHIAHWLESTYTDKGA